MIRFFLSGSSLWTLPWHRLAVAWWEGPLCGEAHWTWNKRPGPESRLCRGLALCPWEGGLTLVKLDAAFAKWTRVHVARRPFPSSLDPEGGWVAFVDWKLQGADLALISKAQVSGEHILCLSTVRCPACLCLPRDDFSPSPAPSPSGPFSSRWKEHASFLVALAKSYHEHRWLSLAGLVT